MAPVATFIHIYAHEGRRDELVKALNELCDHVAENEPGTEVFVMHEDTDDPNAIWFYEVYHDDPARLAHKDAQILKHLEKLLIPELVAGTSKRVYGAPLRAKMTPIGAD